MIVYDGPGIDATNTAGSPIPARAMGSGEYNTLYEMRVVDKSTNAYDPQRLFFSITMMYKDGKIVDYKVQQITEEQYRAQVPPGKGRKRKEKPK